MNRKKLAAVGLAVTLSVSAAACGGTGEPEEAGAEAVAVEVQTPRTGELTVDTAYIGTVAPQEQVYVIPKTSGTVTETFLRWGIRCRRETCCSRSMMRRHSFRWPVPGLPMSRHRQA